MKRWSRPDWLIILLFAALVALFYWRILTPNPADRFSFPPGDFSAQFWAFATLEVRELSAGRLPLWNPYTFAGAPFWADVQSAVFYPPSLLTLLLSAPWNFSLFALEVEAIAHFWLAAILMYLFLRRVTGFRPAAVLGSLTFTFSGYLTGYPGQQLAVLETVVWLPLILFFIHRRQFLPAGLAWGLALLAGHPQSALIVAYISLAYLLFLGLSASPPSPRLSRDFWLRLLGSAGLVFLTGLALAAIQYLPAVEYTRLSVRAEGYYDKMSSGFPLIDLIGLLLPGQVSFYSPLYVGVVGLVLALWVPLARPRPEIFFWAGVALVTLLLSLGGNTFLYSPLYLFGPGFAIFRGQERWALAVAFSLSVLAGYGFKALAESLKPPRTQAGEPAAGVLAPLSPGSGLLKLTRYLFLLAVLLLVASFYGLNDTGWTPASPFYKLLGGSSLLTLLLGLAWLLWQFAPRLAPWLLAGLTGALICFDLFTANWQTNLYPQPPEWHSQVPAAVAAIRQDAAGSPGPYRVYNEFRLYDNYGVPFQLEDLWGASPLRPTRYDEFLAPPMPIERTWELLNVGYVITWRKELYVPSTIIYQEPAGQDVTYVHRLVTVGPRAWLVTRAEITGDEAVLQKIADPAFDRWQVALLEPGAEKYVRELGDGRQNESARPRAGTAKNEAGHETAAVGSITFPSPQSLAVEVTTPEPALLVLSETFYPGWQATVDGRPVPLLRADYVLRAVPLPPGEHRVELVFRPPTFILGAITSGLTVILAAIFLALPRLLRRNSPR